MKTHYSKIVKLISVSKQKQNQKQHTLSDNLQHNLNGTNEQFQMI